MPYSEAKTFLMMPTASSSCCSLMMSGGAKRMMLLQAQEPCMANHTAWQGVEFLLVSQEDDADATAAYC